MIHEMDEDERVWGSATSPDHTIFEQTTGVRGCGWCEESDDDFLCEGNCNTSRWQRRKWEVSQSFTSDTYYLEVGKCLGLSQLFLYVVVCLTRHLILTTLRSTRITAARTRRISASSGSSRKLRLPGLAMKTVATDRKLWWMSNPWCPLLR